MHLEPSDANARRLFERGIEGPVTMLSLLRFREEADYAEFPQLAPPSPISGRDAYDRYIRHTIPFLNATGGSLEFVGIGGHYVIHKRAATSPLDNQKLSSGRAPSLWTSDERGSSADRTPPRGGAKSRQRERSADHQAVAPSSAAKRPRPLLPRCRPGARRSRRECPTTPKPSQALRPPLWDEERLSR
jgi:hypothetical protein